MNRFIKLVLLSTIITCMGIAYADEMVDSQTINITLDPALQKPDDYFRIEDGISGINPVAYHVSTCTYDNSIPYIPADYQIRKKQTIYFDPYLIIPSNVMTNTNCEQQLVQQYQFKEYKGFYPSQVLTNSGLSFNLYEFVGARSSQKSYYWSCKSMLLSVTDNNESIITSLNENASFIGVAAKNIKTNIYCTGDNYGTTVRILSLIGTGSNNYLIGQKE